MKKKLTAGNYTKNIIRKRNNNPRYQIVLIENGRYLGMLDINMGHIVIDIRIFIVFVFVLFMCLPV